MRVLGLDPSMTQFGWAVHDTTQVGLARCENRGRFQTSAKEVYVDRYIQLRENLRNLIQTVRPDKMAVEYPVFGELYSEGMYGLFLYTSEAVRLERQDVVFFSPGQVKANAREKSGKPLKWKMYKGDMVDAAKKDTGGKGTWNHNEADAYFVSVVGSRFWLLVEGLIHESDLTPVEKQQFLKIHTYQRGRLEGKTIQSGILYREDERFFRWSQEEG